MNGDGGQGNPNTHLPKKNPQSNKQSQLEKITQGKLWTITKQHQKTLYGSKGKDGSQKNTGSLLPVSPHPSSTEKFGARKDSLRGARRAREPKIHNSGVLQPLLQGPPTGLTNAAYNDRPA